MPKRKGFLYEQVLSLENCIQAEIDMTRNKRKNRKAKYIKENASLYGKRLSDMLSGNNWEQTPYREKVIYDAHRKKFRNIKIPCLRDQAVHHAIMRITVPYINNRNYYYNCGCIPQAGQTRAVKALKRWQGLKYPYTYAETIDIRKFYENVRHVDVMKALRRIFKDKKFLMLHEKILKSMSDNGVGLAIGYYPSAWYANLVLADLDRSIKQSGVKCHMVRYMDDIIILCNNKRKLRKLHDIVIYKLNELELEIKPNWQIYHTNKRDISFMSYRFFRGYTLLRKPLMYRITRVFKKVAKQKLNFHNAASVISYMGILKYCNSFNYKIKYVYPIVNIKKCKGVISSESKNLLLRTT